MSGALGTVKPSWLLFALLVEPAHITPPKNSFWYFDSSPEVIRLMAMMYVRNPLSLHNVEDLLAQRGIDIRHETAWGLVEQVRTDVRYEDP